MHVETLEGRQFIADLDRELHLSDQQVTDLVRAFREVATMQARIDLHDDPNERENMQKKLVLQLIVRLRLVLGEENAKNAVSALAEKQPRILYKEENN